MNNEDFENLVSTYYTLNQRKKEIDDKLKEIRKQLLSVLQEDTNTRVGDYYVKVSSFTSKRLDTDSIKELLGDEYEDFLKTQKSVRLTVSKR